MKDLLLHIWNRFTELWKNQVDDQYEITEVKESSEEDTCHWSTPSTFGFIKVVINSDLVINWRIQKVFAPRIRKEMIKNNGWDETDESKERILTLLNSIVENRGDHKRIS